MSLRFLSILVLVLLASAQCPIKQNIDNLESATLAFSGNNLNNQTMSHSFKTTFPMAPKIAIAVQHFGLSTGAQGNWSVVPSSIRSTDVSIRFSRNQQVWTKLRINFFATTRNDLILGTNSETFNMTYNSSVTSVVQFQEEIPNFSRSIMRVFLTGYEYKGDSVDIQISGRRLEGRQLSISIQVEGNFYLQRIFYSFVVFAPSNVPYASYGGLIAQNGFSGFYYEDAHRIIYNPDYILYGLNKVTLTGGEPIEFASHIDENFVAGLYSSRRFDELNLIYIVLGVAPINECTGCKATEIYAYQSVCLSQCPQGTLNFQYNDKGYACRLCPEKLNQVLINGKCVCNSISTEKDGVCVLNRGQPYNFLSQISWSDSSTASQSSMSGLQTVGPTFVSPPSLISPSPSVSPVQQQTIITTVTTTTTTVPMTVFNPVNNPSATVNFVPIVNPVNPSTVQPISVNINNNCQQPNQYWTGYRCTCKVGFRNDTNQCVPLTLLKTKNWIYREPAIIANQTETFPETTINQSIQNTNCYLQFEYFNGQGCICLQGYSRINGICTGSSINDNATRCSSQPNKEWVGGVCTCKVGFFSVNNECIKIVTSTCPVNSYDNGLGICICDQGFYKDTITLQCVKGTQCPPSSTRAANGTCVCDAGLALFNGSCAKCPLGSIWDTATSKCLVVCGLNAKYNEASQKCECIIGFGIYNKVCDKCPNNYFIKDNYCVQCPLNSVFNKVTNRCDCQDGFLFGLNGVCIAKCANAETYDQISGLCKCITGLGRPAANGRCQICPTNTFPSDDTQVCGPCRNNQIFSQGKCICRSGFAPNAVKVCVACESLENSFLVDGFCAFCPGDQIYNKNSKKCECPAGKFKSGIRCFDSCKNDELLDSQNVCYSCPINEIISNGQCICRNSYSRNNSTGVCELRCTRPNQFVYQGRCASCPLNLQYRTEIKGCACADGFYLNNYGSCEKVILLPITCQTGFFFDANNGCLPCTAGCSTCTAAKVCTACSQIGFSVRQGRCSPTCGDGLLVVGESCDDRNNINGDGCSSSCMVETFYTCQGSPSICRYNGPAICGNGRVEGSEACDDGNSIDGDGCSSRCQKQAPVSEFGNITVEGNVNTNINNVFVVLRTSKKYSFTNENEMENFMKASFPDSTSIPSVYCSQRDQPDLDLYDCLAIYSSGIPNRKFKMVFSFDYNGEKGKLEVEVDPLKSSIPSRARSTGRL